MSELPIFAKKLLVLIIITPFAGYALLGCIEEIRKAWKSGKKLRKWWSLCLLFFVVAILLGWLM